MNLVFPLSRKPVNRKTGTSLTLLNTEQLLDTLLVYLRADDAHTAGDGSAAAADVRLAEDIQFAGLICQWEDSDSIVGDSWHVLTARINFKFSRAYGKKGPVLTFIEDSPCEVPEQPVATFF